MSILTAIFQAIFQSITWILPLSESGHSAIFHDFANRTSGNCSVLTGVIHISIAIGIIIAMYKIFISLGKEFFGSVNDLFHKRLTVKNVSPARNFMNMTLISFIPLLLWLIPIGSKGCLYKALNYSTYNGSILDNGLFMIASGLLVLMTAKQLELSKNNKNVNVKISLIIGFLSILFVPVGGLSLTIGVFCVAMLLGVSKKLSFRFGLVMSVPILVVTGIVEICTAVTPASVISIIIAIIIAIVFSYMAVKFLLYFVENNKIKYFGIYDITIGAIAFVIGIFEIAMG